MVDNRKPRVGIVTALTSFGGVQAVALSLIRGLNERGIVPDILWDRPPKSILLSERDLQANHRYLRFRVPSKIRSHLPDTGKYVATWFNAIRSSEIRPGYDFYYIFYNGFLVDDQTPHVRYLSGPPLLPQLKRGGNIALYGFKKLYRGFVRQRAPVYGFHRDSNYVINSQFTARLFEEAHGVRLPVVYPPIRIKGLSYDPSDISGRDTITFFSRIAAYKRPELVLQIAARYPQYRLVVMGGVTEKRRPYFEKLHETAASLGRTDAVFLANPLTRQVDEELKRTRFYVFPAVEEHFGMTTVEAIAQGVVPYVHDSGGQVEIVPVDDLRFTDSIFFDQFERLAKASDDQLQAYRSELLRHIQQYSEECFLNTMLSYLDNLVSKEV